MSHNLIVLQVNKQVWGIELVTFTKNFQLDLQGLLSCTVRGHTPVGGLVGVADLLDPQGCNILVSNRWSIAKPADLRARLSLRYTWQSHCLAEQGFQEGGCWQNPGFSWGQNKYPKY